MARILRAILNAPHDQELVFGRMFGRDVSYL
jgi:hypothetical protein